MMKMEKIALITSVNGQDASHLELLIKKEYCHQSGEILVEVVPKYFRPPKLKLYSAIRTKLKLCLLGIQLKPI
jgi:GDP-D-mannose dehydratase